MKAWLKQCWLAARDLVFQSDPEPVIFLTSCAMILFGATLLWPGDSFTASTSLSIMAQFVPENETGLFLVLYGFASLLSLLYTMLYNSVRFSRWLCLGQIFIFVSLGTQFVLLAVNSTGNSYYVYAAGAAWASWRLAVRR